MTPHIGSRFDDFLQEQGLRDTAHAQAIKRVLAWQIAEAMKAQRLTKSEMAKRMNTSRAQLDRLLDPKNDKVQLDTLQRAATALVLPSTERTGQTLLDGVRWNLPLREQWHSS